MGARLSATVTPWAPVVLLADADGLDDGEPLADGGAELADGAGDVGAPVDAPTAGGGRPTVGDEPTSTIRGDETPPTPTTVADGAPEAEACETPGDDDVTAGGAAPATGVPPPLSTKALYASAAAPSAAIA